MSKIVWTEKLPNKDGFWAARSKDFEDNFIIVILKGKWMLNNGFVNLGVSLKLLLDQEYEFSDKPILKLN